MSRIADSSSAIGEHTDSIVGAFASTEQRVAERAKQTGQELAVPEHAHLAGARLHDGVAHGDLPVTAHRYAAITPHREDRRGPWLMANHGPTVAGLVMGWRRLMGSFRGTASHGEVGTLRAGHRI